MDGSAVTHHVANFAVTHHVAKDTCRDWVVAIKDVPEGLTTGASRLASPPPVVEASFSLPSSWDEDGENRAPGMLLPSPRHDAVLQPLSALSEVPDSWEDNISTVQVEAPVTDAGVVSRGEMLDVNPAPNDDSGSQNANMSMAQDSPMAATVELFVRPRPPLLPLPAPRSPLPRLGKEKPPTEARRSARLVSKPKMHAMDKAIHVLNSKMGVAAEGMTLLEARKAYLDKYKSQLPNKTIDAFIKLFKLNIRSMTEADESLIAMAGPGGCETAEQGLIV
jgi:hypothetical protein